MNQNIKNIATSIQSTIDYINDYEPNDNKPKLNNKMNEWIEYLKEINAIIKYEMEDELKDEVKAEVKDEVKAEVKDEVKYVLLPQEQRIKSFSCPNTPIHFDHNKFDQNEQCVKSHIYSISSGSEYENDFPSEHGDKFIPVNIIQEIKEIKEINKPKQNKIKIKQFIHNISIYKNMHLMPLQENISNINDFKCKKFYYHLSCDNKNTIYKYVRANDTIYHVCDDGILYTIVDDKMIIGEYRGTIQIWE